MQTLKKRLPHIVPLGCRVTRSVHPYHVTHVYTNMERRSWQIFFIETWRLTSVIHNQLRKITELSSETDKMKPNLSLRGKLVFFSYIIRYNKEKLSRGWQSKYHRKKPEVFMCNVRMKTSELITYTVCRMCKKVLHYHKQKQTNKAVFSALLWIL